jgi:catechol 2,3-dioxygenase-like lactoylglutathione lyase family enzyme
VLCVSVTCSITPASSSPISHQPAPLRRDRQAARPRHRRQFRRLVPARQRPKRISVPLDRHVAFRAPSKEAVHAFYAAALAAGGKDNGKPGPREGAENYYGAFVLDPDGNNIEACYRD